MGCKLIGKETAKNLLYEGSAMKFRCTCFVFLDGPSVHVQPRIFLLETCHAVPDHQLELLYSPDVTRFD